VYGEALFKLKFAVSAAEGAIPFCQLTGALKTPPVGVIQIRSAAHMGVAQKSAHSASVRIMTTTALQRRVIKQTPRHPSLEAMLHSLSLFEDPLNHGKIAAEIVLGPQSLSVPRSLLESSRCNEL
jgi:hypothetical protein